MSEGGVNDVLSTYAMYIRMSPMYIAEVFGSVDSNGTEHLRCGASTVRERYCPAVDPLFVVECVCGQTKVTIVGKTEIYNRENLIGPFLVHKLLGLRPPPPPPPALLLLPWGTAPLPSPPGRQDSFTGMF